RQMIIYRLWRMKTPSEKCPNFVVQNKAPKHKYQQECGNKASKQSHNQVPNVIFKWQSFARDFLLCQGHHHQRGDENRLEDKKADIGHRKPLH
ncbi:hypothetical protein AB7281_23700, partial [Providencia rettgeri]